MVLAMAIIRSLTLHVDRNIGRLKEYSRTLKKISEHITGKGFEVWTLRISTPPIESARFDYGSYCNAIAENIDGDVYISALNVETESFDPDAVLGCFDRYSLMFGSLLIRDHSELDAVSSKIYRFYKASEDPLAYTRFSTLIDSWVHTPYFPSSPNIGGEIGFSVALRYVDLFRKILNDSASISEVAKFLRALDELLREVEDLYGLRYYGIDLSLSPWMSESVGELIEMASGVKFPFPGSGSGIDKLNRLIRVLANASRVRTVGFNEVMIPVEEDNLLRSRVAEGVLGFRDLIHFTAYCIVGVDMAIVNRGDLDIAKVLSDLMVISRVKGRPLGIRVIPVDLSPGSTIDLGRFGVGKVMKY